jgi:hypothetical protein
MHRKKRPEASTPTESGGWVRRGVHRTGSDLGPRWDRSLDEIQAQLVKPGKGALAEAAAKWTAKELRPGLAAA